MTALKKLCEAGQSVWLDSISRDMLENGTLARYVSDLSVTGLTSNPTIFQRAIASTCIRFGPLHIRGMRSSDRG